MFTLRILIAVMLAFVAAFVLTPFVRKLAIYIGAVDKPDARKVHARIMPRAGGLAIFAGFLIAMLISQPLDKKVIGFIVGSTVMIIVGVIDDLYSISPKVKLMGQIFAALILAYVGIKIDAISNPFSAPIPLGAWSFPVTVFWVIGITNAVNLIDGLDGLAAGISAISALTMAVLALTQGQLFVVYAALFLVAAIFGFLRYNFHPAQIFMGDSGSLFLGYVLAALSVMSVSKAATIITLIIPIIILGVPILDTGFAILRRFFNKKPIFQPDKEHLHHRLLALGFSHRDTVLLIYGITLILSTSALSLTMLTTSQSMMILAAISVVVVIAADYIGVLGRPKPSRQTKSSPDLQKG